MTAGRVEREPWDIEGVMCADNNEQSKMFQLRIANISWASFAMWPRILSRWKPTTP